jgi:hypothetical protein
MPGSECRDLGAHRRDLSFQVVDPAQRDGNGLRPGRRQADVFAALSASR